MRAALIQMPVTADKSENLETACLRLREAKARGADIAVLPEMFCCPYDSACFRTFGEGWRSSASPVRPGGGAGAVRGGRLPAGAGGGPGL